MPETFYVKEEVFALRHQYRIESQDQILGKVYRKILSWTPTYKLVDLEDNLIAQAKMRFWSLGYTFDVSDHNDVFLGTVNEKVSWFFPTFEIISASSQILAEASLNFWGTCWTFVDPIDQHVIAKISRNFFRLKNDWKVEIVDPRAIHHKGIHPHMFLTLTAFQADRERWEDQKEGESNESHYAACALDSDCVDAPSAEELFKDYRVVLSAYKDSLESIDVSEAEFAFIEALTQPIQERVLEEEGDSERIFISVMEEFLKLLDSRALTPGQKSALYQLIMNRIN